MDLGAPVLDGDGVEGNYNLEGGDRPAISGNQMAWWVMNDRGNVHERTGSPPLGIEIRAEAWAVQMGGPLNTATFYRYHVLNRNDEVIDSTYVSFWTDIDLGGGNDDYVGSDSSRMVFTYNAENTDAEYGEAPPAIGVALLTGASSAMAFDVGPEEPSTLDGYYHAMHGRWRDGTPMTAMGNGYRSGGDTTTWAYYGAPEAQAFWSEINTDGDGGANIPSERRQLVTSNPFSLAPGESHAVVFAILYAHGDDHLNSVVRLREVADIAQNAFDTGIFDPHPVSSAPEPAPFGEPTLSQPYPNPFRDEATLTLTVPERAGPLRLADGVLTPGEHALTLDGAGLPSGLYLVRMETGRQSETVKLIHVE